MYIVNCKSQCKIAKATLEGSGIYSDRSSICLAAFHSGVLHMSDNFELTITWPQKEYIRAFKN